MNPDTVGEPKPRLAWLWRIWIYAALYSFALLYANYQTGFHVGLNDFWGNYYQAENLDFSDPETLYDGFFPVGYPLLLRSVPVDDLVASGFLIGAAARVVFLGVFGSLMLLLAPGPWSLVATITLSLVPRLFQHVLTPTADIPTLIPLTLGAALLIRGVVGDETGRRRLAAMLGAGLLLGAAGLLRQHALALALGLMIGCVVVRPRAIGWVMVAGLACATAYSPQMIVSVLANHGPLETAQYVNIYKMTNGIELREIPLDLTHNVREIVSENPGRFFREWAIHFLGMIGVLVPAAIAACWRGDATVRRIGRIVTIGGMFYLAAVAMGWSHRAVLPMLPWTIGLASALLYRAHGGVAMRSEEAARRMLAVGSIALVAAGAYASNRNALLVSHYLAEHDRYAEVEHVVESTGAVHPKQVYTTDGSLYLPLTPPHFPYFDGTWGLFSLYKYAERYPRLDTSNAESFHRDCVREGITHVVLAPNAREVSEMLGRLRENPREFPGFQKLGDVAGYVILRRD